VRWWPLSAVVAVVLIQARGFVDTPNLTEELQATPSADSVSYIDERVVGLFIGYGLTSLGLAFVAVFVAGVAHSVSGRTRQSFAAALIAVGGGAAVATTFIGYSFNLMVAGAAAEDRAPTTVVAIYTIADSLGYIGWVVLGLVTAGVAIASFHDAVFPRWLGWVSAVFTGLFALLAFAPFLSWAPALLWLLVAGVGLLVHERRRDAAPVPS
jgi:MFS family permease